jgi:hypothetical protein
VIEEMSNDKMEKRPTGIILLTTFDVLCIPIIFFWGVLLFVLSFGVGAASNPPLLLVGQIVVFFLWFAVVGFPFALAAIAYGLWDCKRWARMGTLVLCGFNLVDMPLAFLWFGLFINPLYTHIFELDLLVQLLIIWYMLTPRARSYLSH